MDENSALIEAILKEDEEQAEKERGRERRESKKNDGEDDAYAWKTVSYQKRTRKQPPPSRQPEPDAAPDLHRNGRSNGYSADADVFRSIEQHSEERRRRAAEARAAADAAAAAESAAAGSKRHSDGDESDDDEIPEAVQNGEVKKPKVKKPKKPKVTVAEAASKINAVDLEVFLADITASYESQEDILLMRFADYFGRAFASVSSAQFPWLKTFKESTVTKLVDIPLSHISGDVYKTSIDWIGHRSPEALGSFVLWSLDSIFADLASHQGTVKGSKKAVQKTPSKSQVAIFIVLAMTLRRKPDVLINLLPVMRESSKYQGLDKLPATVWLIAQASQGDPVVGLYMWIQYLLPMLGSRSSCNPQSRDLILQLVERIVSSPKARPILLNGAVRKGERLVPPSSLNLLMRIAFPASSARVKATERFEAIYPLFKEIALAGSPESKAMKQVAHQILDFEIKAVKEEIPELSKEATDIFIWCLTKNSECYKQWDMLYMDNLKASVVILKNLITEWKQHSDKFLPLDLLKETINSFRQKNAKALAEEEDGNHIALLRDAEDHCKLLWAQLNHGQKRSKCVVFSTGLLVAGLAVAVLNLQEFKKLYEGSYLSSLLVSLLYK